MFTEWANWGMCTKDCGGGRYTRYRQCMLSSCEGSNVDTQDCNIEPCPGKRRNFGSRCKKS